MLSNRDSRQIAILGVPVEEGAGRQGCRMGPDALRIAGLIEVLQDLDHDVEDYGDVGYIPTELQLSGNANNPEFISGWARSIFKSGLRAFTQERIPIFLGGDHSLSMGSVAAALEFAQQLQRPLHVLWLDAHADFNTPYTSDTGNMHGMSTALLCGESGFEGLIDNFPALPPERLHIFGARSIDLPEKDRLAERSVDVCDMRRLDEYGTAPLVRQILDDVRSEGGMLHVSLDVDFLDPQIAPGVGTAVPGGATFREGHLVMEMVSESGLMSSLDLVELNPFLDERGKSARLMVELAASAFGRKVFDKRTEAA